MSNEPLNALKHHVTGAIERGEKQAIVGKPVTQHTPGPWDNMADGTSVKAFNSGVTICETECGSQVASYYERQANARLIAAAPELLAVASDCEQIAMAYGEGDKNAHDMMLELMKLFPSAAIAKATR